MKGCGDFSQTRCGKKLKPKFEAVIEWVGMKSEGILEVVDNKSWRVSMGGLTKIEDIGSRGQGKRRLINTHIAEATFIVS